MLRYFNESIRIFMSDKNEHLNVSERGFALVLALIACMILISLGALIMTLSNNDIKTSGQILGQKRAMIAAEKGVQRLIQQYNFDNIAANVQTTLPADLAVDPNSCYLISIPNPTGTMHPSGFSMDWQLSTYDVEVTGWNKQYGGTDTTPGPDHVTIGLGIGHLGDASLIHK